MNVSLAGGKLSIEISVKSLCKNVYRGNFILRGETEDLRDLYNIGLGFSRGVGFGNIEVVRCL